MIMPSWQFWLLLLTNVIGSGILAKILQTRLDGVKEENERLMSRIRELQSTPAERLAEIEILQKVHDAEKKYIETELVELKKSTDQKSKEQEPLLKSTLEKIVEYDIELKRVKGELIKVQSEYDAARRSALKLPPLPATDPLAEAIARRRQLRLFGQTEEKRNEDFKREAILAALEELSGAGTKPPK